MKGESLPSTPARVTLPWYEFESIQWAYDTLWRTLRVTLAARGWANLPEQLERGAEMTDVWASPSLLLTQCCGCDLFLTTSLMPLARWNVTLPECPPGDYFSYIVTREGHSRFETAAANGPTSRSGYVSLMLTRPPKQIRFTGSHLNSLEAIKEGSADYAAIDAITWQLLITHAPTAVDGLMIVDRTTSAPAPPFVTRAGMIGQRADALTEALVESFASPACENVTQALCCDGLLPTTIADYERVRGELKTLERLPSPPHSPWHPNCPP